MLNYLGTMNYLVTNEVIIHLNVFILAWNTWLLQKAWALMLSIDKTWALIMTIHNSTIRHLSQIIYTVPSLCTTSRHLFLFRVIPWKQVFIEISIIIRCTTTIMWTTCIFNITKPIRVSTSHKASSNYKVSLIYLINLLAASMCKSVGNAINW